MAAKEGKGRGRPTKRTPETREALLYSLRLGATYKLACDAAGIHHSTLDEWRASDPEFTAALKAAEGFGAQKALERIEKAAAEGSWQAAAWLLERRYGYVKVQELQGREGGPLEFVVTWSEKPKAGGDAE